MIHALVFAVNILIAGDSVSIGYMPFVKADISTVYHNGFCDSAPYYETKLTKVNGEWAAHQAACMRLWLSKRNYKIVHFNAGLWDLLQCSEGQTTITPLSDYLESLQEELDAIREYGAIPIFATTTPVINGNTSCVNMGNVKTYNEAAIAMMQSQGVHIDDLYHAMLPVQHAYHLPNNIHFTKDGYKFLAKRVIASINQVNK